MRPDRWDQDSSVYMLLMARIPLSVYMKSQSIKKGDEFQGNNNANSSATEHECRSRCSTGNSGLEHVEIDISRIFTASRKYSYLTGMGQAVSSGVKHE